MANIQLSLFGKTYPVLFHQPTEQILGPCLKKSQKPTFQCLQVENGQPQEWLEGQQSIQLGECLTLNFSEYPKDAVESLLSDILETGDLAQRYFLSTKACVGLLRRAEKRGRKLPRALKAALEAEAGVQALKTTSSRT